MAGGLPEFRVLPDPTNVSLQRLGEPIGASLELAGVIKKDEIQAPERLGMALSSARRQTIGAKRLFSETAYATSLAQISEAIASGLSVKTMVSAFAIRPSMRFHQSSKA